MSAKLRPTIAAATVLSCVVAAGCTFSNDPSEGGFFNGLHGIASGSYEDRVQQREDQLDATRQLNAQLRRQSEELEAEQKATSRELELLQVQLAEYDANLQDLNHRIRAEQTRKDADHQRLDQITDEVSSLQHKVRRIQQQPETDAQQMRKQMEELRAKAADLKQQLAAVLDDY